MAQLHRFNVIFSSTTSSTFLALLPAVTLMACAAAEGEPLDVADASGKGLERAEAPVDAEEDAKGLESLDAVESVDSEGRRVTLDWDGGAAVLSAVLDENGEPVEADSDAFRDLVRQALQQERSANGRSQAVSEDEVSKAIAGQQPIRWRAAETDPAYWNTPGFPSGPCVRDVHNQQPLLPPDTDLYTQQFSNGDIWLDHQQWYLLPKLGNPATAGQPNKYELLLGLEFQSDSDPTQGYLDISHQVSFSVTALQNVGVATTSVPTNGGGTGTAVMAGAWVCFVDYGAWAGPNPADLWHTWANVVDREVHPSWQLWGTPWASVNDFSFDDPNALPK